ncbi:hypothetical protein QBC38DRAFT_446875 [Podospora fimiseda]|uniref:Uncharacterized protein n=1 Tax=Podospora fimiseda TaxID=252190 RepID=A0AAN7BIP5_9PEZI|nr:hypothetical protein QBC38DRAFT_446875 [Podospora fimiseda]
MIRHPDALFGSRNTSIERCKDYGKHGHEIQQRTILVGYSCSNHSGIFADSRNEDSNESSHASSGSSSRDIPLGWSTRQTLIWKYRQQSANSKIQNLSLNKPDKPPVLPEAKTQSNTQNLEFTWTKTPSRKYFIPFSTKDLRFLWPQVVRISGSQNRSRRNIEALLRLYSNDLQDIATTPNNFAACKFVRRIRRNLSQRIIEALHYDLSEKQDDEEREGQKQFEENNGVIDDYDDSFNTLYATAEAFLFETDPIIHLQSNLTAFVQLQTTWDSIQVYLDNIAIKFWRNNVKEGKTRVTWTCVSTSRISQKLSSTTNSGRKCWRNLYDDFIELTPGAVKDLEDDLRYLNTKPLPLLPSFQDFTHSAANSQQQTAPSQKLGRLKWNTVQTFLKGVFKHPVLPQHKQRIPLQIPGACQPKTSPQNNPHSHTFLLLCMPYFQLASKLQQPDVCRINSDQELFHLLRNKYDKARSRWNQLSSKLRKVQGIEFVQFELYSSQLVDLRSRPSVPDVKTPKGSAYVYDPVPVDYLPPIGSNHLTHLFHHPDHAEPLPLLHRKIPKLKKPSNLTACPIKDTETGWGLHFIEGTNWNTVFILGCVGFLLSLLVAIIWAVCKNGDVQGKFAMAGFTVAFRGFVVGYLGSLKDGDGEKVK